MDGIQDRVIMKETKEKNHLHHYIVYPKEGFQAY